MGCRRCLVRLSEFVLDETSQQLPEYGGGNYADQSPPKPSLSGSRIPLVPLFDLLGFKFSGSSFLFFPLVVKACLLLKPLTLLFQ